MPCYNNCFLLSICMLMGVVIDSADKKSYQSFLIQLLSADPVWTKLYPLHFKQTENGLLRFEKELSDLYVDSRGVYTPLNYGSGYYELYVRSLNISGNQEDPNICYLKKLTAEQKKEVSRLIQEKGYLTGSDELSLPQKIKILRLVFSVEKED